MRHPKETTAAARFGSILDGETLPFREACRRMGWAKKAGLDVRRAGLKAVMVGRSLVTTGRWVREFVETQAEGGQQ